MIILHLEGNIMVEFCEHKFESIDKKLNPMKKLCRCIGDTSSWDTCVAIKTSTPIIFTNLFEEVKGFKFNYDIQEGFILTKGVEYDILDFIKLVEEENPDFKCEIYKLEPITVFDPTCSKCEASLDVGRVIKIGI
jgi:hypothetical protein